MKNKFNIIYLYDYLISFFLIIIIWPLFLIILLVCFIDLGSPIFIQKRVGKNKKVFYLYKFRTMKVNSPIMDSHKIDPSYVTKIGKFIRKFKLDELPQLINILKGEMSLVGPRPNLLTMKEVIFEREKYNLYRFKPGVTGYSQLKKIDMSDPIKLAKYDSKMMSELNQLSYFKYLFATIFGKGKGDRVIYKK